MDSRRVPTWLAVASASSNRVVTVARSAWAATALQAARTTSESVTSAITRWKRERTDRLRSLNDMNSSSPKAAARARTLEPVAALQAISTDFEDRELPTAGKNDADRAP